MKFAPIPISNIERYVHRLIEIKRTSGFLEGKSTITCTMLKIPEGDVRR
jgi:hypothetical protein